VRQPIATWNPARGAWEVPRTESLLCEHLEVFSRTWPSSGMTRRGTAYAPPTSAPLTAGSASSSSPGPLMATPDASVFNDGQTLQAWQERHERERAKGYNGNGGGTPLAMQVQMLPTPQARDTSNHGGSPAYRQSRLDSGRRNLDDAVGAMLPTPTSRDTKGESARAPIRADGRVRTAADDQLPNAVLRLPTPKASDGDGSGMPSRESARRQMDAGRRHLPDALALLPTPTAMDLKASGGSTPTAVTLTPDAIVRTQLGARTNPRFADGNEP
jgi:hypothetical protein